MEILNSKIKGELENIVALAKECCDGTISESFFRDVFQSLKGKPDSVNAAKEYLIDRGVQIISDSSLVEFMDDSPDVTNTSIIKPYDPSKIDISPKNMALVNLIGRIENDEVDMMPDFQRRAGLWSSIQKSQLIESLILRIPLPAFYFDGTDNDRWITIDGLQRLTTLKEFFVDKTLHLTGLEFLRDLNGANYDNIPKVYIRRMHETQVVCYIINPGAPVNLKYNIFKRINTGGLELEPQEIRHALYQGFATKYLKELAETQSFLVSTGYSIPTERMLDREFVLRFIAFYEFELQTYNGSIDDFLNRAMEHINKTYANSPAYAIQIKDKFLTVLDACYSIFGKFSFRRMPDKNKRRSISKALFETWTSLMARLDLEQIHILIEKSEEIQKKYMPMFTEDEDFYRSIGSGKVAAVRKRFEKIDTLIKAVLSNAS